MANTRRDRPRREAAEHLQAVIAVQQEIATADLDLARTMDLVTLRATELTHATGGAVELLEGDEMVYRAATGQAASFVGLRLRARSSLSGLSVQRREVLVSDDTETDPRVDRAACRRIGARSIMVVPLMFRDSAVGVLKVMASEPGWFHDEDASTLQLMAGLVAAAVAHAQAFEAQADAARRRTAELESLLANAPIGIAFFDREHRYVRINRTLAQTNGRPVEEHLGRTIFEVLGEAGKVAARFIDEAFETGMPVEHELAAQVPGGEIRHWIAGFFPLFLDEGDLQLVGVYTVDITERKRSSEALQRTNALVNAIFTSASLDVIYVKDRQGRIQLLNDAALALIGLPKEQVLGKTDVEFLGPQAQAISETDQRIMEHGEPEVVEDVVALHGQAPRIFLSSKSPYRGANGEILGLIGISKDITERQQAEQRLRTALDELERQRAQHEAVFQAVKDGIVVFDSEGRVMMLNESEAEICGYASAEEMRRDIDYFATVFELGEIGGAVLPVSEWPVSRVLRGESIRNLDVRGRRLDTGQEWFFSFSGEPVRDDSGALVMAVLITRDITAYKRAELGLREGVRARDEFVSVASHELKTPLTSLQLQVDTLRRKLLRGEPDALSAEHARRFAEQTARQTARLGQLVDDMLDISRIASGKFAIDEEPMDLSSVVTEVVDRLRPQLEAANGGVVVRAPESVPGRWDRHRIEQVLSNLLTNAMRYGKGAPVEVSLERESNTVHLAVRDHGMGIPADSLGRIFERFERAISANEVSGLGLGLFISRQIVEAHRGRIWVDSELGKGATFHVQLPL